MKPNAEMMQAVANHGSAEVIMETNVAGAMIICQNDFNRHISDDEDVELIFWKNYSTRTIHSPNSNRTHIVYLLSQSLAFWFCHSERHEWLYVLRVAGRIKSDDAN